MVRVVLLLEPQGTKGSGGIKRIGKVIEFGFVNSVVIGDGKMDATGDLVSSRCFKQSGGL